MGGAIAEGLAWQWIFWLNIPIGLVVIPLVLGRTRESFGAGTALDIAGLVLVTGAAFGAGVGADARKHRRLDQPRRWSRRWRPASC